MAHSKELRREARLMRRDVKHHYKTEKKTLKARCIAEIYGFYERVGLSLPKDPPKRTLIEEIGNAVSHGIGAALSLVGLTVLLAHSHSAMSSFGAAIYSLGLFAVFFSSCMYHAFAHGSRAKRIARRFDYASVYLLIGATFLPIVLHTVSPMGAYPLLFVQWSLIFCGALAVGVLGPERLYIMHIAFYLALGWSALLLLPSMWGISTSLTASVFGGGILFTVGVIPCAMKWNGAHFLWHVFVLTGAAVQWVGILTSFYL